MRVKVGKSLCIGQAPAFVDGSHTKDERVKLDPFSGCGKLLRGGRYRRGPGELSSEVHCVLLRPRFANP